MKRSGGKPSASTQDGQQGVTVASGICDARCQVPRLSPRGIVGAHSGGRKRMLTRFAGYFIPSLTTGEEQC